MVHVSGCEGERTAKGQAQCVTLWIPGQARDDGGGWGPSSIHRHPELDLGSTSPHPVSGGGGTMVHVSGCEGERTAKGQAQCVTLWIPGQARDDGGGWGPSSIHRHPELASGSTSPHPMSGGGGTTVHVSGCEGEHTAKGQHKA